MINRAYKYIDDGLLGIMCMYLYFRYKVQVASRDVEAALADEKSFDPFAERKVENPTT